MCSCSQATCAHQVTVLISSLHAAWVCTWCGPVKPWLVWRVAIMLNACDPKCWPIACASPSPPLLIPLFLRSVAALPILLQPTQDTGRNGIDDMRDDCSNWCNIRGAGLGLWPTASTALPDLVDAYYWLKTPGESDGCTSHRPDGSDCPRYDGMCGSLDSIGSRFDEPFAPEAGMWFAD